VGVDLMIKAIYIARENGDYDFVAAFSDVASKEARQSFLGKVLDGKEVIVKNFKDLEHLTDVIEGWEAKFEKKLGAIK
jgi:hypothetical protein